MGASFNYDCIKDVKLEMLNKEIKNEAENIFEQAAMTIMAILVIQVR